VVCWLIAGAIVMPLLGLALPAAQPAAGAAATPPDPMVGSFMMLHLGPAAPIAALVAWVMFGAVLGASSQLAQWSRGMNDVERRRALALASGVAVAVVVAAAVIAALRVTPAGLTVTSARTLATGPVEALPPGADFVSVIDLIQAPGATLGPHAHVAGFAYDLRGVETLDFSDGTAVRVGPGEGGFMGMQVRHAHVNADRVPAAIVALLIVVAAVALSLILIRRSGRAARFAPAALVLLIAASMIGIWNPWSNDWLFLSVRPVSAHGAAMPLPTSSRVYESPDLGALPPGPYTETLQEITLAPGAEPFEVGSTGVVVLLGLDGSVHLESADGTSQIGAGGATLVRTGSSVRISDAGERLAHVLSFTVAPRQ
jgi:quercetin dioxygenase-like cupin family protein